MKTYLCAILLVSMCIKSAAQSDVATAKWMQQPATIDGRLAEWKQPLSFYDSDTRLFFDLANDSNTIYLCFESRDEMSQAKLMRAGMKIILSTKGKSKREASIAYPLPQKQISLNDRDDMQGNEANTNPPDMPLVHNLSSFRDHFMKSHTVMDVEGFAAAKGEVPLTNSYGITAAINWDSASNFIYEIAIPEKEFFGADYAAKDMSAGDITLTVDINAVPRSSSDSKGRNNESSDNGISGRGNLPGMDMRRGQFNGGGYNAGNDGIRQISEEDKVSMNKKSSFKQKFVLGR